MNKAPNNKHEVQNITKIEIINKIALFLWELRIPNQ